MSLPNLPTELVVRCITPFLNEGPASNIEEGVSAAMVVFKTCKRMHAMLSEEELWKDVITIALPWVPAPILASWREKAQSWRCAATSMIPYGGMHGMHMIEANSVPIYLGWEHKLPSSDYPLAVPAHLAPPGDEPRDGYAGEIQSSACRGGLVYVYPTPDGIKGLLISPCMGRGRMESGIEDSLFYVKKFAGKTVLDIEASPSGSAENKICTQLLERSKHANDPADGDSVVNGASGGAAGRPRGWRTRVMFSGPESSSDGEGVAVVTEWERAPPPKCAYESVLAPSLPRTSFRTVVRSEWFADYDKDRLNVIPNTRTAGNLAQPSSGGGGGGVTAESESGFQGAAELYYKTALLSHASIATSMEPPEAAAACNDAWMEVEGGQLLDIHAAEKVLGSLAGLWVGEYGSHGYELLYLSSHQDAATVMTKQTDGSPLILRVGQPNLPSIDLVGLKVTGDPNVPSGQATFCVTGHGAKRRHRCTCRYACACPSEDDVEDGVCASFMSTLQTAMHGFINPRWNAASIALLRNGELLLIWSDIHSRRLRRVMPAPGGGLLDEFVRCQIDEGAYPWGTTSSPEERQGNVVLVQGFDSGDESDED